MNNFKAVIAIQNGRVIDLSIVEQFDDDKPGPVDAEQERLAWEWPYADIQVVDAKAHWSVLIMRRHDSVAAEEYEAHQSKGHG